MFQCHPNTNDPPPNTKRSSQLSEPLSILEGCRESKRIVTYTSRPRYSAHLLDCFRNREHPEELPMSVDTWGRAGNAGKKSSFELCRCSFQLAILIAWPCFPLLLWESRRCRIQFGKHGSHFLNSRTNEQYRHSVAQDQRWDRSTGQ